VVRLVRGIHEKTLYGSAMLAITKTASTQGITVAGSISVNVVAGDIVADGGAIYVIDAVLLP
jgi:uncharacterized surface protein with fasciclin (FAS1) repeats